MPLVTAVSLAGITWSNDHAKMLRTMIVNMQNRAVKCQRKKLRPMSTFTTEFSVTTPAKKFSTPATGRGLSPLNCR